MSEHCPTCGTPCTIEGKTTLHYKPESLESMLEEIERLGYYFDLCFSNRFKEYSLEANKLGEEGGNCIRSKSKSPLEACKKALETIKKSTELEDEPREM